MLIEQQFPQAVGGRATLRDAFIAEATNKGSSASDAELLFTLLPVRLADAACFFDRVTDLWRYEFGRPFTLSGGALLGPHVWQPVTNLVSATRCASRLLQPLAVARWMAQLQRGLRAAVVARRSLLQRRFPLIRRRVRLLASWRVAIRACSTMTCNAAASRCRLA
jgi:hypothetical protein